MSWEDRIAEGGYIAPDGNRISFQFEDVETSVDKRVTEFNLPNYDGSVIQDLGRNGRQYPIRAFFTGDNCDLDAAAFEALLLQRGIGRLLHPFYGSITVVPTGSIKRIDRLKTAANQSILEVTFLEAVNVFFPGQTISPRSQVRASIDSANNACAEQFEELLNVTTVEESVSLASVINRSLVTVNDSLAKLSQTVDEVSQEYQAIENSVQNSLTILVGQPLNLASQVQQLVGAPARAASLIQDRLSAYNNLFQSLTTGPGSIASQGLNNVPSNNFHYTNVLASATLTAVSTAVLETEFETAPSAIAAASFIIGLFDALTDWRDDNFASLDQIDTGAGYQELQELVSVTAGYLIEISFTAAQERVLTLDRARTIVDVCAQLYGTVDKIDFLINSNSLTGSEILELPIGRELKYYV